MLKQWIVLAFLVSASPLLAQTSPAAAPQGRAPGAPTQSAAEWQRKHDIALKYRSLEDVYNAMKKEGASKLRAPLPDWSGIWTADALDSFAGCLGGNQCHESEIGPTRGKQ